ncbi:hypothetical protein ACFLS9_09555 [Bacteroidota bacterium]
MDSTYLFFKNISKFEPQENKPEGEIHQDWTFFSYDKVHKTFAVREFHSEGFVNYYLMDTVKTSDNIFVFISESSENAPPGMRARVTYVIKSENEFTETFDLAFSGKEFQEFLRNHWTRKKND